MVDAFSSERGRLRKTIMASRDLLSAADREAGSERIASVLLAHPLLRHPKTVFLYCHFRSEVQTSLMIGHWLAQGKTVCVPVSVPKESGMVAVAITDPARDLAPGYMGIPEPRSHLIHSRRMEPASIEAAVIPGTVFDRNGHRLGYGMGFYDRFLVRAPQAIRIGLAFSCQVVEFLPTRDHDLPMDMIVTEEEVMLWPGRLLALGCSR
ncbi:MAG: 5-formyltetrahydrofolate cyclo-ligase [Desulfobulbus sp.]|jgi:5-formyltetrahydrofolate cyclo-ligase|uniref:5-formyltetrahydrofolate cyclo-ligase n=1 Tax=Desulfobulbus sp. TaxID=895 RepID=UPI0028452120|nr:5-formyltetrahydrofolate cyclo-ligase [Desulfobulbus sp.]MDR2551269.1 5-formyltetrahydrofolate cyclo-ligase [Desulfobulbus sp.]